jgi:hypothetical protein
MVSSGTAVTNRIRSLSPKRLDKSFFHLLKRHRNYAPVVCVRAILVPVRRAVSLPMNIDEIAIMEYLDCSTGVSVQKEDIVAETCEGADQSYHSRLRV